MSLFHHPIAFLMILVFCVSCFPEEQPHEEEAKKCVPAGCSDRCGEVEDCGDIVDCGPCLDEEKYAQFTDVVDVYIDTLFSRTFVQAVVPVDQQELTAEAHSIIRSYFASEAGLVAAIRHVMLASRIGHLAFWEGSSYTCSVFDAGDGGLSLLGACAVPYQDDFVITQVTPTNVLGLSPGDRIVGIDDDTGEDMYDYSLQLPVCGVGAASDQARREEAARSLFSALPPGVELTVVDVDGNQRIQTVPQQQTDRIYCRDPLGRDTNFAANAYTRDDGVAVIHLPGFAPVGGWGTGDPYAAIAVFQEEIHGFFELVKDAPALIWDVRSNTGGASPIGFAIAAGMPGARSTPLARCSTRIPDSDPPDYWYQGPDYDLEPGSEFDFSGPVAVLIDGRSISAADYFARAVKLGTDALLVGTPSAGAYGGSGQYEVISQQPHLVAGLDPYRCNDLNGEPLETHSVHPDLLVEYLPEDLAAGVDTVMEAAAAALLDALP